MTTAKLLEGVGGTVADTWGALLLTPAFGFWLGGGVAAVQRWGWGAVVTWVGQWPEPLLLAWAIAALLTVVGSGWVVRQGDLTVLRWLEGYWPQWCAPLSRWGIRRQRQRLRHLDQQVRDYCESPKPTPIQVARYLQSIAAQRHFPSQETRLLPTRLGNCLRAAEDRPRDKYGLDAVQCWPRLWLLLPDTARSELFAARSQVDGLVQLWIWSGLFCLWALIFQTPWPLGLGLLGLWLAHHWLLGAVETYGLLVESAFDLYRFDLYAALRWPLPPDPTHEQRFGQQLSRYLLEGSDGTAPPFNHPN